METAPVGDLKREQILRAAAAEFAKNGYAKASTNVIIREAGVSKGLLFHYFGAKRELYLAVVDDCIDQTVSTAFDHFDELPKDLIERLIEISHRKLAFVSTHPEASRILYHAFMENPPELEAELSERRARLEAQYMPPVLENIDRSLFQDGVDPDLAISLVSGVLSVIIERMVTYAPHSGDSDLTELQTRAHETYEDMLRMIQYGIYRAGSE